MSSNLRTQTSKVGILQRRDSGHCPDTTILADSTKAFDMGRKTKRTVNKSLYESRALAANCHGLPPSGTACSVDFFLNMFKMAPLVKRTAATKINAGKEMIQLMYQLSSGAETMAVDENQRISCIGAPNLKKSMFV